MPDIMHLVRSDTDPRQVYAAITTSGGIRSWWTADADIDREVGGTGVFRFYGEKTTSVRIDELSPGRCVVWSVSSSFRSEWIGTTITFALSETDEGTVLRFQHRGFPAADDDYALCTTGWGIYLGRLQEYLTTGQSAVR